MSGDGRFIELWNDYLEGDVDDQGVLELRRLLEADDRLLQIAADSYRTHRLLGLLVQDSESRHEAFVRETLGRLPGRDGGFVGDVMQRLATGREMTARMGAGRWFMSAAAVAVVLLAILFFLWSRGQPEIATITDLSGSVHWTGDGGRVVHDLEVGSPLRGGTLQSVSVESWATLQFHDGSTVTLSGRSILTISEIGQKEIHLREGSLSASIARQRRDQSMLIHTPTAKLEVLGTQLNIEAEPYSTTLQVNEGRVRVTRLADGRVAEVPADHQVVVSASRLTDFVVKRRPEYVRTWQSSLPTGAIYGEWMPGAGHLRTTPVLLDLRDKPSTLYLAALSISRCAAPPVLLMSGSRFRIHGHIQTSGDMYFGLTVKYVDGGFAGKYHASRHFDLPQETEKRLDIDLALGEFEPQEQEFGDSPVGLELVDWSCFTYNVDLGLTIASVELLPPGPAEIPRQPTTVPPPLPITDIWAATAQGNLDAVKRHIEAGAALDATFVAPGIPASGATPLHIAVFCDQGEIAQFLIERRADLDARARDEHGGTPLHWAAALGRYAMARRLIEAGADVNAKDNDGFTPLDATKYDPESGREAKLRIAALLRSKGGKERMQD
ncbi:MAG: ankyrin repeat domain-containing protein [Planctomycetes bacterium]|nr:ankyrin repeat domain-containing protein [Planctomycetota bacterium]